MSQTRNATGGFAMAMILKCRDVGVDCDYVCRGETEEELFRDASAHGREAHGMTEIPAELVERARLFIRTESTGGEKHVLQEEAA